MPVVAALTVKFAVYGGLKDGNENLSQAANVQNALQAAINKTQGIVTINNTTMGGDPSFGTVKSFAAVVALDGVDRFFACGEGQTIDFFHTGALSAEQAGATAPAAGTR